MAGKKPLAPHEAAAQREAICRAYLSERGQEGAARAVGVSQATVSRVITSAWGKKRVEELKSEPGVSKLAERCSSLASSLLDSIEADLKDPEKLAKLSVKDKTWAAAVLIDKYQILQPKQSSSGSGMQWQVNVSFPGIKSVSGASGPLAQVNVATIEHNPGNMETKTEGNSGSCP